MYICNTKWTCTHTCMPLPLRMLSLDHILYSQPWRVFITAAWQELCLHLSPARQHNTVSHHDWNRAYRRFDHGQTRCLVMSERYHWLGSWFSNRWKAPVENVLHSSLGMTLRWFFWVTILIAVSYPNVWGLEPYSYTHRNHPSPVLSYVCPAFLRILISSGCFTIHPEAMYGIADIILQHSAIIAGTWVFHIARNHQHVNILYVYRVLHKSNLLCLADKFHALCINF